MEIRSGRVRFDYTNKIWGTGQACFGIVLWMTTNMHIGDKIDQFTIIEGSGQLECSLD